MIIKGICILAVCLLVAYYFFAKRTRHSERSEGQKLVNSLAGDLNDKINSIIKSGRGPEVIKREIIRALDQADEQLNANYREFKLNLVTCIARTEQAIKSSEERILTWSNQAKGYKQKFEETGEESYKGMAIEILKEIQKAKTSMENMQESLKSMKVKSDKSGMSFELAKVKLSNKRVEINSMVNNNFDFKFMSNDLTDLTVEFKGMMEEENVKNRVNEEIAGINEPVVHVNTDEINSAWDKL
ncbi:MAG: hypothetical protein ACRDCN_02020 [Tannerellaceae bacterium]